ncbi:MAG: 4Fe-4S binding protein [Candidatus Thorarchaeota archaeon]
MVAEKLFPISINPHLCVRCERCMYSCPKKRFFLKIHFDMLIMINARGV